MVFKKLSEKSLKKLKKKRNRQACLDIVARIEDAGVVVDLTKYPDTIPGFIDGIREYQEKLPIEVPPDDESIDAEDKEQLSMETSETLKTNTEDVTITVDSIATLTPTEEPENDVEAEETTTEPEESKEEEETEVEVQTEDEVKDDTEDDLPPYNPSPDLPDWRDLMSDTPAQFVRQTYIRLLEREPDSGGQSTYVMHVKSGMPREQLLKTFKRSDEYKQLQRMKKKAGKL